MHDNDWEGFENFTEQSSTTLIHPLPLPSPKKPIPFRPIIRHQKKRTKNHSEYDLRNCKVESNQKKMQPLKEQKVEHQNEQSKTFKRFNIRYSQQRIEKIPIIKINDSTIKGQMIFKGAMPKSSHKYFNNFEGQNEINLSPEIQFSSKFQSGNLSIVTKLCSNEYNLYIKSDTNTKGHRQWFNFKVCSKSHRTVKFNIYSFKKPLSLFQQGMKPYGSFDQIEWQPIGSNVKYILQDTNNPKSNYFLTFELQIFPQTLTIASCIPYSYSKLTNLLSNIFSSPQLKYKQTVLCKTLSGVKVPLISISPEQPLNQVKKFIIINARTHPGESSSSWVLEGLLLAIFSSHQLPVIMNEHNLCFKIVPMLNPDGVIMGNYRTGVIGSDYNRLFLSAQAELFPEITALKELIKQCKKQGNVDLYLDLHGHSILKNSFIFGPHPNQFAKHPFRHFHTYLSASPYFSLASCRLQADSRKIETSRIYFQIKEDLFALTCEISLGLYTKCSLIQQFGAKQWSELGQHIVQAMIQCYCPKSNKKNQPQTKKLAFTHHQFHSSIHKNEEEQDEEEFNWVKSKTDDHNLPQQIQIMLQRSHSPHSSKEQQQQCLPLSDQSDHNDSDCSSDDLPLHQQKQLQHLLKIALKPIKPHSSSPPVIDHAFQPKEKKQQLKCNIVNTTINNFKEYRFGTEQSESLANWEQHKRIFSVPKPIRQEATNYFMFRKINHRPKPSPDLTSEPVDFVQRIKTEHPELGYRKYSLIEKCRSTSRK